MPSKARRVLGMVLVAVSLVAPLAAADRAPRRMPLSSVLEDLQAAGLPVVFSDALVRPGMTVAVADRRHRSPRQALDAALAAHGLEARDGPGGRVLVVASRTRAATRPVALAPGLSRLKLVLRTEEGGALAPLVAVPQLDLEIMASPEGVADIPLPPGSYRIAGSLDGFEDWERDGLPLEERQELEVPVVLRRSADTVGARGRRAAVLTLTLAKLSRHAETVEVLERATSGVGAVPLTLGAAEVQRTPGAFEDVFRTLQFRPGVTLVNEAQGRFSVRSGGPDQNLTLMDGVEIHNPFHVEALVGAFSPEIVESFDFSSGGMAARHGDRLASVLEVHPRSGRADRRLHAGAAVDAASSGLTLEGSLPGAQGGSWIASARRSTPGHLMERLTRMTALQHFEDLYLRVDWPGSDHLRLSLWTLRGREATRDWPVLQIDEPGLAIDRRLDYGTRSETWAAAARAALSPTLSSSTVLSRYADAQEAKETAIIRPYESDWSRREQRRVRVADLALRQDFVLRTTGGRQWEAGFEVHGLRTGWTMDGHGLLLADWSLFRGPSLAPTPWGSRGEFLYGADVAVDSRRDSVRSAAWLQGETPLAARFVIEPGLRVQRSSINGETTVLPRARVTWQLGANRLSAALAWQAQSPGFEKVLLADMFLDYGGETRLPLSSERSRQLALAWARDFGPLLSARLELFHTRFDRLIVGRFEPARPEEDIPAWISSVPVNGGQGRARGAELWLRVGAPTSSRRSPAATLAYSYGVARRQSYGISYPFDYDRRHALGLTAEVPLGRHLALAAAWKAASGLPYTPFVPVPQAQGHGTVGVRLEDLNSARHPFYSRLDVRAAFTPRGPAGFLELYADVVNVLNYDIVSGNNGPGFKPSAVRTADGWQVVVSRDHEPAIVPTFGLRLRF